MATANSKKTAKKKVAKKAPLTNTKLHAVLGDKLMRKYETKCKRVNMTKSEVARLLAEAFANGTVKITPATVSEADIKV